MGTETTPADKAGDAAQERKQTETARGGPTKLAPKLSTRTQMLAEAMAGRGEESRRKFHERQAAQQQATGGTTPAQAPAGVTVDDVKRIVAETMSSVLAKQPLATGAASLDDVKAIVAAANNDLAQTLMQQIRELRKEAPSTAPAEEPKAHRK